MRIEQKLIDACLEKYGIDNVMFGKGGAWIKGDKFYSIAKLRKLTGVQAPERNFRPRISAYGDYAIIAKINHIKG